MTNAEAYAYLTVTYRMADGRLSADPVEIDSAGKTWEQVREQAYQRLGSYNRATLVSATLVQWGDKAINGSAHPSGRTPLTYCFQPDEMRTY